MLILRIIVSIIIINKNIIRTTRIITNVFNTFPISGTFMYNKFVENAMNIKSNKTKTIITNLTMILFLINVIIVDYDNISIIVSLNTIIIIIYTITLGISMSIIITILILILIVITFKIRINR